MQPTALPNDTQITELTSLPLFLPSLAQLLAQQELTKEHLSALHLVVDYVRSKARSSPTYGFSDEFDLFVRKMYLLSSQMYGARIQNYFAKKLGLEVISSKIDRGDLKTKDGKEFYEFKFSFCSKGKRDASLVQIRLHQDVTGYIIVVSDSARDFKTNVFRLSKSQMEIECSRMRATSAHGTKTAIRDNKTIELRMDLSVDGADFERWVADYSDLNAESLLFRM